MTSITIGHEEWDRVARFTTAIPPDLDVTDGVWLLAGGDHRRWSARRTDVAWIVDGETDGQRDAVCLPAGLVWFAAELSSEDGFCNLDLGRRGSATVKSTSGHGLFDLVAPAEWPDLPAWPEVSASVCVDTDRFLHAISACRRSAQDQESTLVLASRPDQVDVSLSRNGPMRATYGVPADTDGTGTAGIGHRALSALLGALAPVDGHRITVDLPGRTDEPVGLHGDGWKALVATHDLTARRWSLDLEAALDDLGIVTSETGAGVYQLTLGRRTVRAALHSGPPEVVRFSTVLSRQVPPSGDLWDHLNDANRSLAAIRVWHDPTGAIVAATDVPCGYFDVIGATLEALLTQLDGFDVFLAAAVT